MSKIKKEKNVDILEDLEEQLSSNAQDDTVNEFKVLTNKVTELEEKILRNQAEFINFKRRKDEELSRMLKYANEDIALELIQVLDNFDRALTLNVTDEVSNKYLEGFRMIHRQLKEILGGFEIKEIECLDTMFDPTYHQSVMVTAVKDKESGVILEVLQKGYMLKDKVIRPAMVRVNE